MVRPADLPFALLFAERPSIGPIVLNCTVREEHGASYTMTSEPIEDGSVLTDHRIRNPRVLEIEGIISPRPDTLSSQLLGGLLDEDQVSVQTGTNFDTAWSKLLAYADDPRPSEVVTRLETYPQMLCEQFTHTEDGREVIHFQMTLREIQVARIRREQFLPADFEARGQGEDDLGLQGTEELSDTDLEQVTGYRDTFQIAA